MVKVNHKQLKASLALEVRKLKPVFLALNLNEFPLFDSFLELVNFWNSDNFLVFNNFTVFNFTNFSINLLLSSILLISLAANILLVPSNLLATKIYDNTNIFSIDASDMAILLKL